jgi:hypothetical protein
VVAPKLPPDDAQATLGCGAAAASKCTGLAKPNDISWLRLESSG